jgi:hypothetical protein
VDLALVYEKCRTSLGDWRDRARNSTNDGRLRVNKHYDVVDAAEREGVLSDLINLVRDGVVPLEAFTYTVP